MAGELLRIGERYTENIVEFVVDTVDELQYLPTTTKVGTGPFKNDTRFNFTVPMGSKCIVAPKSSSDSPSVYMLFTEGWFCIS